MPNSSEIERYQRRRFLATSIYAAPIALANSYLAGSLFVDYLVRSCNRPVPRNVQVPSPSGLSALTAPACSAQTHGSAGIQAPGVAVLEPAETEFIEAAYSGQKEMMDSHE